METQEATRLIAELSRRKPFDRMSQEHLRWLVDRMELVEFPNDMVILSPETRCDALYFIHRGMVVIEAMGNAPDDKKVLAELVEGESFPLEALEESRPVFSTWRAKADTICYKVAAEQFDELKKISNVFAEFCRYRAASFLEQSRRAFRLHFSHQAEEHQRLGTPLSILMCADPLSIEPEQKIRDALAMMKAHDTEVVIVADKESRPLGLFTLQDLLHNVVIPEVSLDDSIDKVMSQSFKTLPVSALGYEAALAMATDGLSHIVVIDKERWIGVVREHELFNLQRVSLPQINAEIHSSVNVDMLKRCCQEIHLLAENMLVQGVAADQITQIISTLNDQVVGRICHLEMAGYDFSQIRICWLALGSEGRLEQTFSTDQDNAIIFEAPEGMDDATARARLLPFAKRVNQALDAVGFPLCQGNIMASNPACCLSFGEWQKQYQSWIRVPTPEALLKATIFFDFRHLYGEAELSDRLRRWLQSAVIDQPRFFYLLAENALERTPPIGFFRDFIVDGDEEHPKTIDIKRNGVTMFIDAARVYALAAGVSRANTKQRLVTVGDVRKWKPSEVNGWAEAFSFLQSLRVRHQFELHRGGEKSHNHLNPYELNNLDYKFLLESLRQAGRLQKKLSQDFAIRSI